MRYEDLPQGLVWTTSSYSDAKGDCVEVALCEGHVLVRDSKNRAGGALRMSQPGFAALVQSAKDLPNREAAG
ncbi:DUF397 domain-containing protein [Amycolatopsis pithecellobii]|uniref:DUF397 domain-containing protein n=1 Tax=Amycolatopsis pithecellobii TaxID=664692 RepID=A0A6N7YVS1_9PSEU|nr:DUF397 domain-containing protein [Amycolatopsis pithecellobii]MTD57165.1 DUF397 domain-containing protein [Amycolatopsis pithecellobii]